MTILLRYCFNMAKSQYVVFTGFYSIVWVEKRSRVPHLLLNEWQQLMKLRCTFVKRRKKKFDIIKA